MKADEVVKMFRHYRHDLLNDLQLVHGYASMGNMDKMKEIIQNILKKSEEERKLTQLNCPHFMLWLMNFNSTYENIRLTYRIQLKAGDFSTIDLSLLATCNEIIQHLHKYFSKDSLYDGELYIYDDASPKVQLMFPGPIPQEASMLKTLETKLFVEKVDAAADKLTVTMNLPL